MGHRKPRKPKLVPGARWEDAIKITPAVGLRGGGLLAEMLRSGRGPTGGRLVSLVFPDNIAPSVADVLGDRGAGQA